MRNTGTKGRYIFIGDVHGCIWELERLIDHLKPTDEDTVVFVGDLVNRGPESHRVVEFARELGALSVIGNHEARLVAYHDHGDMNRLKAYDFRTLYLIQEEDWDYMRRMPATIEFPEIGLLTVHAGFLPGLPWRDQDLDVITQIQVVSPSGEPAKRADCPEGRYWADYWEGPPYVVYGHTPMPRPYETRSAMGIDTGCVYGGHLTAFVMPEKRLYQVQARTNYADESL